MSKKSKQNTNLTKFPTPVRSTFLYVLIFALILYFGFQTYKFVTKKQISVYEVQAGTIVQNTHYNALIVRTEQVVTTDRSGTPIYYKSNNTTVGLRSNVYAIDDTGTVSKLLNEAESDITQVSYDSLSDLEESISDFVGSYSSDNFSRTYSFITDFSENIDQAFRISKTEILSSEISSAISQNTLHNYLPPVAGFLSYYQDGGENLSIDSISFDDLDTTNYQKTDLRTGDTLSAGDAVYKLVTEDEWYLVMEISEEIRNKIIENELDYIEITFDQDRASTWASTEIREIDGRYMLVLTMDDGVYRYADDRFTSVELNIDEESGLKIPKTSLVEKEFYVIPQVYFYPGSNSTDITLLVRSNSGDTSIAPEIYSSTEDSYYIDPNEVEAGTVIVRPDSGETLTLGDDTETATLTGVYNVNRGYAIFNPVEILYENQDYCIIKEDTAYGVDLYDHIALDSSSIVEDEVIY